jgi:hypothetical protein
MKKLAIFTASVAVGIGVMFSAVSVAADVSPAAVEVVKAPITTSDECMCGSGDLVFIGPCLFLPGYGAAQIVYNRLTGQTYYISCTGL